MSPITDPPLLRPSRLKPWLTYRCSHTTIFETSVAARHLTLFNLLTGTIWMSRHRNCESDPKITVRSISSWTFPLSENFAPPPHPTLHYIPQLTSSFNISVMYSPWGPLSFSFKRILPPTVGNQITGLQEYASTILANLFTCLTGSKDWTLFTNHSNFRK